MAIKCGKRGKYNIEWFVDTIPVYDWSDILKYVVLLSNAEFSIPCKAVVSPMS